MRRCRSCRVLCPSPVVTVGAFLLWIVWMIVLSIVGSPRVLLYLISARVPTLPTWVFVLLISLLFLACGGCLGALLCGGRQGNGVIRYRSSFFATVAVTLCYLWYDLFFGARFFLPALILSTLSAVCFLAAATGVCRVFCRVGIGFLICFGIDLYFVLLSLLCFLLL